MCLGAAHTGMGHVTDLAPAGLVPAAWLVTAAVHGEVVTERALLIALVVMSVMLAAFAVVGREEMAGPVLGVWRQVILAGFVVTVAGAVGLWLSVDPLLAVSLYGWMLLPGAAYIWTGQLVPDAPYRRMYMAAGALSIAGAVLYGVVQVGDLGVAGLVVALVIVGVGQSAGMVTAALQNVGDRPRV